MVGPVFFAALRLNAPDDHKPTEDRARTKALKPLLAAVAALPVQAELEAPPSGMTGAELIEATATVGAVNQASHCVGLKGLEGSLITVRAGDDVKNLDQVKPGERVDIQYDPSMAVDAVATAGDASASERKRSTAKSACGH